MKPECKLVGEDGNIFDLMALASLALKHAGLDDESTQMIVRIIKEARSYDEAIEIVKEYVEVQ